MMLTQDDSTGTSAVQWDDADEVEVPADEMTGEFGEEGDDPTRASIGGEQGAAADGDDGPRPMVTIKGRVIDKREAPVASAKVALTVQGRGRRGRISKEVVTAADGTFAFSGKGYSRLFVSLNVKHDQFAVATAFKNFNSAKGELDMGDIKLFVGGTIIGSITDMAGNTVPEAQARLTSMDWGRRFRGRGRVDFPVVMADSTGVFKMTHVPPGRYRVNATAPRRQRSTKGPITVVDEETETLLPIQLGPGFSLTGTVYDPSGEPVTDARVNVRGKDRNVAREDTRTDKAGEFEIDHLPPGRYDIWVRADGFLTNSDNQDVEVTTAKPLSITLELGLSIEGVVMDSVTSQPVLSYGAKVRRIGGLPDPEADRKRAAMSANFETMMKLRGKENLTPQEQEKLNKAIADMRSGGGRGFGRGGDRGGRGGDRGGDRGGRGGDRGGNRGGDRGNRDRGGDRSTRGRGGRGRRGWGGWNRDNTMPGDTGDVEDHPNGVFRFAGLNEGVYVVDIGSPDHQKLRSAKIELRRGQAAQRLTLTVQPGLAVRGTVVTQADNRPLANADIELRMVIEDNPEDAQRREEWTKRMGGMATMFRQFMDNGPRTTRVLETRTRRDGSFEFRNAPPGEFVIKAEADGHSPFTTEAFKLAANQADIEIALGELGLIEGRVSGVTPDRRKDVRVIAFAPPRTFRDVSVRDDNTFEITGLEPGGYMVRAFIGDARRFMFQQMFRSMGTEGGDSVVDVKVREGGRHRHNVVVTADTTGSVRGTVLVNGEPATGYRVSLRKVQTAGESQGMAGRFGRFGRNGGTVDQKGVYEIKGIEMGDYTLTVSPSSRGRRSSRGTEVAKMQVFVAPESVKEMPPITVDIGSLKGTIAAPADPKAKDKAVSIGGRITLYKGVSQIPDASETNVLRFSARIRKNSFEIKNMPTGDYLVQLRPTGREVTTSNVYIAGGTPTELNLTAGATRKPKAPEKK